MKVNKIEFAKMGWVTPSKGIKEKSFVQDGKKIRLLELAKGLEHPNWCENGHFGFVVEGEIDIDFADRTEHYKKGDVLIIADGEVEKHIPRPTTETVILFLIDRS